MVGGKRGLPQRLEKGKKRKKKKRTTVPVPAGKDEWKKRKKKGSFPPSRGGKGGSGLRYDSRETQKSRGTVVTSRLKRGEKKRGIRLLLRCSVPAGTRKEGEKGA